MRERVGNLFFGLTVGGALDDGIGPAAELLPHLVLGQKGGFVQLGGNFFSLAARILHSCGSHHHACSPISILRLHE